MADNEANVEIDGGEQGDAEENSLDGFGENEEKVEEAIASQRMSGDYEEDHEKDNSSKSQEESHQLGETSETEKSEREGSEEALAPATSAEDGVVTTEVVAKGIKGNSEPMQTEQKNESSDGKEYIKQEEDSVNEQTNSGQDEPRNSKTTTATSEAASEAFSKPKSLPSSLEVKIYAGDRGDESTYEKTVTVQIVIETAEKQFLGGYKDKRNGKELHNASTNTMYKRSSHYSDVQKFCRDAQTVFEASVHQQTKCDNSTQMTSSSVYVSTSDDYEMEPGPYFTSQDWLCQRTAMAIKIQSFVRGCFGRRRARYFRQRKDDIDKMAREWKEMRRLRAEDMEVKAHNRRIAPRTKEDFEVLYAELEEWRARELEEISNPHLDEDEKKAKLMNILAQETKCISALDRLKVEANEDNRQRAIIKLMEAMSASKKWPAYNGTICEVETPVTLRAKELMCLYQSLVSNHNIIDERLDVLLQVKYTVKEFKCDLTTEIVSLIDREADMLLRGLCKNKLGGLRRRVANLFWRFIETPEFNPASTVHQPVPPTNEKDLEEFTAIHGKYKVYYCRSCCQYLPSTSFRIEMVMKKFTRCKNCQYEANLGGKREANKLYVELLKKIRIVEERNGENELLYLIQEGDMQHLVEKIWGGQSALSGWNQIQDLMVVRWNKSVPLSPWNCIVLTEFEAEGHIKSSVKETFYSTELIERVEQKHFQAKQFFKQLAEIEAKYRSKPLKTKQLFGPFHQHMLRKSSFTL
eukprot:Nk52_evm82s215 gene=Nk52_evmTU82s215